MFIQRVIRMTALGFVFFSYTQENKPIDVTVIGNIRFADGLGRLAIGLLEHLKNDLEMNFIYSQVQKIPLNDVPTDILPFIHNPDKTPGAVSILFEPLWYPNWSAYKLVPQSNIKIAYSMLESTAIPKKWVHILNSHFDLVVVPDKFYVDVYKNSGVRIPIFVLPHGIYIDDFLQAPLHIKPQTPFVFGLSAGFWGRKNQELLIEAFAKEFCDNKNVILKLHGRFGDASTKQKIKALMRTYNCTNIIFIDKILSQKEYVEFMKSLDCYVLLSKGEGYSVTPKEQLALGRPCIISDNTAHKTITRSGHVKAVKSKIEEPAYYELFGQYLGYQFNCHLKDVQKALKEVYANYHMYLKKAHAGREWVKQFTYENLKPKYLGLLKPRKVTLGTVNKIGDYEITTNSPKLYRKYQSLIERNIAQETAKTFVQSTITRAS